MKGGEIVVPVQRHWRVRISIRPEPIDVELRCKSRIKHWAYKNAYTLIFLSAMFVISWAVLLVSEIWL